MKIIGRTENGYILDASRQEIANLLGFYSSYGKGNMDNLKVGAEIHVSALYQHLYTIANAKRKLADAQKELRAVADALAPITPVIPEVSGFSET